MRTKFILEANDKHYLVQIQAEIPGLQPFMLGDVDAEKEAIRTADIEKFGKLIYHHNDSDILGYLKVLISLATDSDKNLPDVSTCTNGDELQWKQYIISKTFNNLLQKYNSNTAIKTR